MSKPLLDALALRPLRRPPVWIMRQAGRHLPEYREIRQQHSFQEVASTPELAAEVTLQPIRRYGMDGAVIFADIMTPLEAMGVELTFNPGPNLNPMTLEEVAALPDLEPARVSSVTETIRMVRREVPSHTAVIGFAGAPVTLLAYLLEGSGSKEFMAMRSALQSDPSLAAEALDRLALAMNAYLSLQVDAGAEVVQLFDTWAGLLDGPTYERFAIPSARTSLAGLAIPRIYFAPGAAHTLGAQGAIDAEGFGVDWRVPLKDAFERLPSHAIQGNLDPAVLRSDPDTIVAAVNALLAPVEGRTGHIMNLGHGIDRHTTPENVAAFVEAVRA